MLKEGISLSSAHLLKDDDVVTISLGKVLRLADCL